LNGFYVELLISSDVLQFNYIYGGLFVRLKKSAAEKELIRWFETGISYNLILGSYSSRVGLDEFELSLNNIDPIKRIYAASLINKAFLPNVNVLEIMSSLQDLGSGAETVIGPLYRTILNYPNWSWELLTNTKRSVLSPKNMLKAYYTVRQILDKSRSDDCDIDITNPTLRALSDLECNRKLTSKLVSINDIVNSDGTSSCRLHAHGLFKERHEGVHRHIIEVAHELSLGKDPLDKVKFAMLSRKKYSQWASILQAIFCYCEGMTPQNFIKNSRDWVPREYLNEVCDANIISHQLSQLLNRQKALKVFIHPNDDDYSQSRNYDPIEQLDPLLVRKMVLCHYTMFYLTMLHYESWSISLRECRNTFKKRYHQRDLKNKWFEFNTLFLKGSDLNGDLLYKQIHDLFKLDPIGLPLWAHAPDLIPEPLELLKEYFGNKGQEDSQHLVSLNEKHATIALLIPKLLKIDISAWLKPPVMIQEGEPLIIYSHSDLQLSERLHLAGLVKSNGYVYKTLADNLTMKLESLEHLLMGVCYLWHVKMNGKISLSSFQKELSHYAVGEISSRSLGKRKDAAQKWLKQWPEVSLFDQLL
jgi:hypothetical protein